MTEAAVGLLIGFFWVIWIGFFALMIAAMVFWIVMLVDAVKRDFPKPDEKTVWVILIALVGVIAAIIYYFMIKRKDKKISSSNVKNAKVST